MAQRRRTWFLSRETISKVDTGCDSMSSSSCHLCQRSSQFVVRNKFQTLRRSPRRSLFHKRQSCTRHCSASPYRFRCPGVNAAHTCPNAVSMWSHSETAKQYYLINWLSFIKYLETQVTNEELGTVVQMRISAVIRCLVPHSILVLA